MVYQKFIIEIRYQPDPTFLDKRGSITKQLLSSEFEKWIIQNNRIDLPSDNGFLFASYSNIGFSLNENSELDKYLRKFDDLLKIIGDLPPIRWGVRILTLSSSRKSFSKIVNNYKTQLLNFKPSNFSKIDGNMIDVGLSYEFEKDHNVYHLSSGPMQKEQAEQFFQEKKEDLPQNGIFVDLDIYRKGKQFYGADYRRARIMSFVKEGFENGQKAIKEFLEVIDGQ